MPHDSYLERTKKRVERVERQLEGTVRYGANLLPILGSLNPLEKTAL